MYQSRRTIWSVTSKQEPNRLVEQQLDRESLVVAADLIGAAAQRVMVVRPVCSQQIRCRHSPALQAGSCCVQRTGPAVRDRSCSGLSIADTSIREQKQITSRGDGKGCCADGNGVQHVVETLPVGILLAAGCAAPLLCGLFSIRRKQFGSFSHSQAAVMFLFSITKTSKISCISGWLPRRPAGRFRPSPEAIIGRVKCRFCAPSLVCCHTSTE